MAVLSKDSFFFLIPLDSSVVGTAAYEFKMNFDVVLKNIRELNILAGEGCSEVSRTKDGARLKVHIVHSLLFTLTQSLFCPLAHKAICCSNQFKISGGGEGGNEEKTNTGEPLYKE